MAARDETGPSGQGEQDQDYGGDLPALVAHQGVPDCRFLSAQAEGRGHEGERRTLYIDPREERAKRRIVDR